MSLETLLTTITSLFVLTFGASIGSFLNVVIYRLPAQISLVYPPSRCPRCKHHLGVTENVPVLGWLWLKGRCRWCQTKISYRYPLIEAITGLLFLLIFWQFSYSITTLGYWILISFLTVLALIDLDTMILPNSLTQSGLILGLLFQSILGWNHDQIYGFGEYLMIGVGSAVIGIWLFDVIIVGGTFMLRQPAMGQGDAKLAAMIGAWLGWKYLLLTAFIACVIGAFTGGSAIAFGKLKRRQPIPFGPFLVLAAIISIFSGEAILITYMNIFFP